MCDGNVNIYTKKKVVGGLLHNTGLLNSLIFKVNFVFLKNKVIFRSTPIPSYL